jgi:TPR repeat protein
MSEEDFSKGGGEKAKKAAEWYTKSANQGYAKAQASLGAMYDPKIVKKLLNCIQKPLIRKMTWD